MTNNVEEGKKIRLCIVVTVPISIIYFNGKQIDFLTDKGFDVTIITSPDKKIEQFISKNAHLLYAPLTRAVSPIKDFFALIKVFNHIRKGAFDIVQYSSPKAALLASMAAWICRVRVRLYLMWGLYYVGQKGFKRLFLKLLEKIVCFFSSHVSPDSNGNLRFAAEEGLCPISKMSVVGNGSANGVDLERFHPQRLQSKGEAIRNHLCIPKDALVLGFVGRLRRDKGTNELVQAFMGLKEKDRKLYLLLVGPQENTRFEYEPEVYTALFQEERIILVGYQECPEYYMAAMDIFVSPSHREGFGVASIEASAMGLPVISTNIPGPCDAVLNNKTGILVSVNAVLKLQKAIETLVTDLLLRQSMGQAGMQWAKNFEQKLLWDKIFIHRISLLQESQIK